MNNLCGYVFMYAENIRIGLVDGRIGSDIQRSIRKLIYKMKFNFYLEQFSHW